MESPYKNIASAQTKLLSSQETEVVLFWMYTHLKKNPSLLRTLRFPVLDAWRIISSWPPPGPFQYAPTTHTQLHTSLTWPNVLP